MSTTNYVYEPSSTNNIKPSGASIGSTFDVTNVKGAGSSQSISTTTIVNKVYNAPISGLDDYSDKIKLPTKGTGLDTKISGIPLDPSFYAEKPIIVATGPLTPPATTGSSIAKPISADDVSETATRIWFTPDDLILLIDTYKLVHSADFNVKQEKVVVWVIQPGSLYGQQDLVARFPYKGVIKQISAICVKVNALITVNIYRTSKLSFESGTPNWTKLDTLTTTLGTGPQVDFNDTSISIPCNTDDYFTIEVINDADGSNSDSHQVLAIDAPITVEMVIALANA